jgi:serine/threonine protein kinase
MSVPETPEQFLGLIRKSGLIEEGRLRSWLNGSSRRLGLPGELGRVAGLMVRDGLLTYFQAEQFLMGKWKRFTIGEYRVLERLGAGTEGAVYLCLHNEVQCPVAIKVLPAARASDPARLELFYNEARRLSALDHPNVVRAVEITQVDRLHFLVMHFVDGFTLKAMVAGCEGWQTHDDGEPGNSIGKKRGPMEVTRAAHYIRQAAEGLQHIHEVGGFAHGDIEPTNLMLDRTGQVKIIDLGGPDASSPYTALVQMGELDIRGDIYDLGAVFYFLLTGYLPSNNAEKARRLARPIQEVCLEIPEGLAAIVKKMVTENVAARYQTPRELVEDLAPWTEAALPPPSDEEMPCHCPAVQGVLGL